ncbi:hypothetical protein M404DRAFT_289383 [Pisolithus tinctorius Marx 270]|uniref:Uncharacterized protein n=1 Tax=Pisolithus tinctorius Marx 270 TaxID=870435 RepID=A0A0C3P8I0_PISTI|nr:hypothetical protein M404DRAFT_289383 [Pisolithus tinctorius Marx 270]
MTQIPGQTYPYYSVAQHRISGPYPAQAQEPRVWSTTPRHVTDSRPPGQWTCLELDKTCKRISDARPLHAALCFSNCVAYYGYRSVGVGFRPAPMMEMRVIPEENAESAH